MGKEYNILESTRAFYTDARAVYNTKLKGYFWILATKPFIYLPRVYSYLQWKWFASGRGGVTKNN